MTHHDHHLQEAERKLVRVATDLIHRKSDLDERQAVIERKELIARLESFVPSKSQTPAAPARSPLPPPKQRVAYVRGGGAEEWVKGRWVPRDAQHWESLARGLGAQVLEVYDLPAMSTVVDNPTYGRVIVRGCMVCGVFDLVRPSSPIRFGGWWGSLCIEHHREWEALSISERKRPGLFVTRALRSAGFIDPSVPAVTVIEHSAEYREEIPNVLAPWRPFTWAHRVMKAEHPEAQQPMSQPFGFLSGPLRIAQKVT